MRRRQSGSTWRPSQNSRRCAACTTSCSTGIYATPGTTEFHSGNAVDGQPFGGRVLPLVTRCRYRWSAISSDDIVLIWVVILSCCQESGFGAPGRVLA